MQKGFALVFCFTNKSELLSTSDSISKNKILRQLNAWKTNTYVNKLGKIQKSKAHSSVTAFHAISNQSHICHAISRKCLYKTWCCTGAGQLVAETMMHLSFIRICNIVLFKNGKLSLYTT